MPEDRLTGRTLGAYELEGLLGEGGCARVYRARLTTAQDEREAGALVALKVFHPELITDGRVFQRFEREAELGMRIRHAHVVPSLDCGAATLDGTTYHFMAMELVHGETLRAIQEELGVLPEQLVFQVADQILDALSAIHAEGMIHRDVKPENIVLTEDHQVRLMDLGVARLQQEGRDLTRADEFVGSLTYAAPEQFINQDYVDARADLYAFGVLLYELATGENPFDAPQLRVLIERKLQGHARRPKVVNRDLDPLLDEVIVTCIQPDPDNRFESCEAVRAVLRERERSAWWMSRVEEVDASAAAPALQRLRPPREAPLAGRTAELTAFHAAFDRVSSGSCSVALVSGGAGVGKSRMVHDFLEGLLPHSDATLLVGHCPPDEGRAHHPFLEAIDEHQSGELPANGDQSISIRSFLERLAAEHPLVLVLEDLHHADSATLALVSQLGQGGTPMLIVATVRPGAIEEGSAHHALMAELRSRQHTTSIDLEALEAPQVEELLASLVGAETARELAWPLMDASSGNPYVLLSMVQHLKDTSVLVESKKKWTTRESVREVAIPDAVRVLQLLRLVDVPPDLMQTLEVASVLGMEFDASVLASVLGEKRLRLLKRLAVLERRHHILFASGRRSFRFDGRTLHRVIYEGMRKERRVECHALCADALAAGDLEGEGAFRWVRHMLRAGRLPEAMEQAPAAIDHVVTQIHVAPARLFLDALSGALPESATDLRAAIEAGRARLKREA